MPATNGARDFFAKATIGDAVQAFDNANAYIGVGDSTTAFAASQTDVQAAANKFRKGMNATYPQRATNVLTFQATFLEDEANFHWNEWAVFNDDLAGDMLNRIVQDLGTKPDTEQWRLTVTLTYGV